MHIELKETASGTSSLGFDLDTLFESQNVNDRYLSFLHSSNPDGYFLISNSFLPTYREDIPSYSFEYPTKPTLSLTQGISISEIFGALANLSSSIESTFKVDPRMEEIIDKRFFDLL